MSLLSTAFHSFSLQPGVLKHGTVQKLVGRALRPRRAGQNLTFIPMQLSHEPDSSAESDSVQVVCKFRLPEAVRPWSSIAVQGTVRLISEHKGKRTWEIIADKSEDFCVVNSCEGSLPWFGDSLGSVSHIVQAQNRDYLLGSSKFLRKNIRLRSKITHAIRVHLHAHDWDEISTPVLVQPSEGGAREYLVLVPDKKGQAYALQQSPQQQKQLLIASSVTPRYFQIAKCFRAESARADRQPEFEQVDLEMAFVSGRPSPQDISIGWNIGGAQVRVAVEQLIRDVFGTFTENSSDISIPVVTYQQAMSRWGSDKPDCRFGLELEIEPLPDGRFLQKLIYEHNSDIEPEFLHLIIANHPDVTYRRQESIHTFSSILREPYTHEQSRDDIERNSEPIFHGSSTALGNFRLELRSELESRGLMKVSTISKFLWVTEFPLFTFEKLENRWKSTHHPFTAPMMEDSNLLTEHRWERVRGQHYDLVLNGMELGGGSVRIHQADVQLSVLHDALKWTEQDIHSIQHLLTALSRGAPPHGGFAFGLDRLVAALCQTDKISNVIAFPKSMGGTDHLFQSPVRLTEENMAEAGILQKT